MNKARLWRVSVLVFYGIVIVSLVTLVPATLNYLEFWAALGHFYLRVDSFVWSRVNVGGYDSISITANLTLFDNSSYVGLKYHSVDISIYYGGEFETLFEKRFWLDGLPVEPFSKLDLPLRNDTNSVGVRHFFDLKGQGEPVQLYFATSVNLYLLGQSTADRVYLDYVPLTV